MSATRILFGIAIAPIAAAIAIGALLTILTQIVMDVLLYGPEITPDGGEK